MRRTFSRFVSLPTLSTLILCILLVSTFSFAAVPDRIQGAVNSSKMVQLAAGVSLKAQSKYDEGKVDPAFKLDYVTLLTVPSPSQQQALNKLLAQQQNPRSPNYHKWLTPEQYASRFGLSAGDLNRLTAWLKSEGFTVLSVARGGNSITFSGTAGQVENALHTEIHHYNVDGQMHFANTTKPYIPAVVAGVVTGFRGLNDFQMKPMGVKTGLHHDFYDSNLKFNFIAPGDISTIYDLTPLYTAGIDGTGLTLAVAGQTDIYLADITYFRNAFALPAITGCTTNVNGILTACNSTNLKYVLLGTDPGAPSPGDLSETDLDLEWSGAVARNAQVIYVNGETAGGVGDAFYYAIDNNLAPVVSLSYGICEWGEALNGAFASDEAELQFANSEGITFLNSTGDTSSAGCDGFTNPGTNPPNLAIYGIQTNYPASSPEVTGVGGTALPYNDLTGAPFWGTSNGATGGSALEYIPEQSWNDPAEFSAYCTANPSNSFCTGFAITTQLSAQAALGLGGGGGGASNCVELDVNGFCTVGFAQPSWQAVNLSGITASRFVPDVSLMASPNFPGYIFCTPLSELGGSGSTSSCASGIQTAIETNNSIIGGTSVSTPVFAGMVTLLNHYLVSNGFQGSPGLGNINPALYQMATYNQTAFHPVTTGTNTVYCVPGTPSGQLAILVCPNSGLFGFNASTFDTATSYNEVTGLGSVDGNNLATAWGQLLTPLATFTLTPSAANIVQGASETLTIAMTPSSASGVVSLFVNGSSSALGTATVTAGSGQFTTTALPVGTDSIVGTYVGTNANGTSSTATVTVTVPDFTLANTGVTTTTVLAGVPGVGYSFNVTPAGGASSFAATVNFSCPGLDPTIVCVFSPASIAAGTPGTPGGPVTVPVTLTITTSGPNTSGSRMQKRADNRMPWLPFTLPIAGVVMVGLAGRKWSKYSMGAALGVALVLIGVLIACGSSSSAPVAVSSITPSAASLYPNNAGWPSATQAFTATVTGSSNTAVTWSISPSPAGAAIDANGNFTSPTIAAGLPATITVTATSQADTTKTKTATVALKPTTVPGTYPTTITVTESTTTHTLPPVSITVQ